MLTFPPSWSRSIGALTGEFTFDVAGLPVTATLTERLLERVYLPVLSLLEERAAGGRVVGGLAGIPGSGKSTFGAVVQYVADRVVGAGAFAVVGMDGWHYPNAVLAELTTRDSTGTVVPLSRRKGSAESFDTAALARAIAEVKRAGRDVALPVYDRRRHEPVAAGVVVPTDARVVLFEGNYLLNDTGAWAAVSSQLSPRLLLRCDLGVASERVIARHIRGGSTPTEAAVRYDENDRLNTEVVLACAERAEVTIDLEQEEVVV